jgi:hypothetical protein
VTTTITIADSAPAAQVPDPSDPYCCPQCRIRYATVFVSVPQYGFGGDPAYGSFRSNRCEPCLEILRVAFKGYRIDVSPLIPRPT